MLIRGLLTGGSHRSVLQRNWRLVRNSHIEDGYAPLMTCAEKTWRENDSAANDKNTKVVN